VSALDDALRFFNYAKPALSLGRRAQIHEEAVAELARLKAQLDAMTRNRDYAETVVSSLTKRLDATQTALRVELQTAHTQGRIAEELRAQLDAATDALRQADTVMAYFKDEAVCDHSVNICWCEFNRAREATRAALSLVKEPRP
jgi:uncharacterized protein YigA (DUF484 family)